LRSLWEKGSKKGFGAKMGRKKWRKSKVKKDRRSKTGGGTNHLGEKGRLNGKRDGSKSKRGEKRKKRGGRT